MSDKNDKAGRRRSRLLRLVILTAILAASTGIGLAHSRIQGQAPAGVDALCPFGGLEAAFGLLTAGSYLPKLAASSLILLAATVVLALVFRRSFCGQICPLGTIQELFGKLGRRVFGKRREMPAALDRPARLLKYVVLAVFSVWTWAAAELVMRPYDPWATYHHLTSDELLTTFPVGLAVLGLTVAGSVVYDRFFCKYLCPMGAFLGIVSLFGAFKVRRDAEACIDCGACDKACPMNVKVSRKEAVADVECISCSECVNACPVPGALEVKGPRGTRIGATAMTGAVLGITLLVLGVTTATGDFSWTTKSIATQTKESGSFDPSAINGRSTLKDISEASGVPLSDLLTEFKVPESAADKPMKEIKDEYGFSPDDVRVFVGGEPGEGEEH